MLIVFLGMHLLLFSDRCDDTEGHEFQLYHSALYRRLKYEWSNQLDRSKARLIIGVTIFQRVAEGEVGLINKFQCARLVVHCGTCFQLRP